MQFSYWEKEVLVGRPDVLVIGGGLVGLSTALFVKKMRPKLRVVVAERSAFSAGASTRNAGFACFGSVSEIADDLSLSSENEVYDLVEARYNGLLLLRNLIDDQSMDYHPCGGYELFENEQTAIKYLDWLPKINAAFSGRIGKNVFSQSEHQFGFAAPASLIYNPFEGKLNPGKLYRALLGLGRSEGIEILHGCNIESIEPEANHVTIKTSMGSFEAVTAVNCTNGFARTLMPELDVRPARNLVLVSEKIDLAFDQVFHFDKGYVYFREADGRLLLGGARNADLETEFTSEFGVNPTIEERLKQLAERVIMPGRKIEWAYSWTGIMGLGPTKKPILKKTHPRLLHAVRLGGMGVALGPGLGKKAAEKLINEWS